MHPSLSLWAITQLSVDLLKHFLTRKDAVVPMCFNVCYTLTPYSAEFCIPMNILRVVY